MQLIIQRVDSAEVFNEGVSITSILDGYLVFLCFHPDDTEEVIMTAAKKLKTVKMYLKKQIAEDESFLFITNFTILGKMIKTHLTFHNCMEKSAAEQLYKCFLSEMRKLHPNVQNGQYATNYNIKASIVGPFNLLVEFRHKEPIKKSKPVVQDIAVEKK